MNLCFNVALYAPLLQADLATMKSLFRVHQLAYCPCKGRPMPSDEGVCHRLTSLRVTWCMPNFAFKVIAIYLLPIFLFLTTELTASVKTMVTSTPAKTKRSRKGKKKERRKEEVAGEEKEQAKKRSEEDALNWERQPFHGNLYSV